MFYFITFILFSNISKNNIKIKKTIKIDLHPYWFVWFKTIEENNIVSLSEKFTVQICEYSLNNTSINEWIRNMKKANKNIYFFEFYLNYKNICFTFIMNIEWFNDKPKQTIQIKVKESKKNIISENRGIIDFIDGYIQTIFPEIN